MYILAKDFYEEATHRYTHRLFWNKTEGWTDRASATAQSEPFYVDAKDTHEVCYKVSDETLTEVDTRPRVYCVLGITEFGTWVNSGLLTTNREYFATREEASAAIVRELDRGCWDRSDIRIFEELV